MVSMREVAKLAGVSVATVSRYYNNKSVISKKSLKKVESAIKQLDYEPNVLGRNLRKTNSKLLLLLIPKLSNPFYSEIIDGIQSIMVETEYNVLLCETSSSPEREALFLNLVKNKLADGIISMDPNVNKERLLALSKNYPVIQCSEYIENESIPYITINHESAAYNATSYLLKLGHEKIALVNSDNRFLYSRKREKGFRKAFYTFNKKIDEKWVVETNELNFKSGMKATQKLLSLKSKPTAIFFVSDILAIGGMKEIQNRNLIIPKDLSIIGFDNISFSEMVTPALTTISQPMYEMGRESAKNLIKMIEGKTVRNKMFDYKIIERDST